MQFMQGIFKVPSGMDASTCTKRLIHFDKFHKVIMLVPLRNWQINDIFAISNEKQYTLYIISTSIIILQSRLFLLVFDIMW